MDKVKSFLAENGQGISVAFVVASLVAEQNRLITGLFFAVATGVALFIGRKLIEGFFSK